MGTLIQADDLMLLCSNCHTAVHQGDAVENLSIARAQFAYAMEDDTQEALAADREPAAQVPVNFN